MRRSGREAPEHAFGTRVKFRSLPHRTPLAMHAPSSTEPLSGCCCSGGEFIPADNCTHGAGHRVSRRCCGEGVYCGGGHTGALTVTSRPRTPQQSNRTGERKSQDFIRKQCPWTRTSDTVQSGDRRCVTLCEQIPRHSSATLSPACWSLKPGQPSLETCRDNTLPTLNLIAAKIQKMTCAWILANAWTS